MKQKELFNESVGKLIKAYLEGTLEHDMPCSCAIGILFNESSKWVQPLTTYRTWKYFAKNEELALKLAAKELLEKGYNYPSIETITGYPIAVIDEMEEAFESVSSEGEADPDSFRGLMAVIDVLIGYHEVHNKEEEKAKILSNINR